MLQWQPILAGRTAALQLRCSASLYLCVVQYLPLIGLIRGILPWYCQFNEIKTVQSVEWEGVFCCPRSPSWLKGNDRTAVEVQGGVALLAVLFASVAMAMGFYHLVVPPSIFTVGEAHFATKDVPECCWSWAQGAWKSFIQPLLEACGGGETYSPCLYSTQVLPTDLPFSPQNQQQKFNENQKMVRDLVLNIWQMLVSCITCIAGLIFDWLIYFLVKTAAGPENTFFPSLPEVRTESWNRTFVHAASHTWKYKL